VAGGNLTGPNVSRQCPLVLLLVEGWSDTELLDCEKGTVISSTLFEKVADIKRGFVFWDSEF